MVWICTVIHRLQQHRDLRCSAELSRVCFQTEKRGCFSMQQGVGRIGSPPPQQAVRAGSSAGSKQDRTNARTINGEEKTGQRCSPHAHGLQSGSWGSARRRHSGRWSGRWPGSHVISNQPLLLSPSEIEYWARLTSVWAASTFLTVTTCSYFLAV